MKLESNNNRGIIYRIAKSNLMGKKRHSFFSLLSIVLSITFVTTIALFLTSTQTAEKRMLENMQHAMFISVSEGQMEEMGLDPRTEIMVPYKEGGETFQIKGVKYRFLYLASQEDKIQTYVPTEGREPEEYGEIVVDKQFMDNIGQECKIGEKVLLNVQDRQEEFVVCGYTDQQYAMSTHSIYVSRAFANQSSLMKDMEYTALVRIVDAPYMEPSAFETTVYQMAMDHGVKRSDVNINGRFEESLQSGNMAFYTMALISLFILIGSSIVIYSIFYLSVASRTQQIGQLLTIGMTQRQIRKMVRWEGIILDGISIPMGVVLGGVIAYFLEPEGWEFLNYVLVAVTVGIFGMIAVQISIGKPAALAAKVSPIEAAQNSNAENNRNKGAKGRRKLTAFVMAQLGQGKNHKKRRLMTASLAFGGVVFMTAASYLYAWDELAYAREGEFENAEYIVSYLYNAHNPSAYGPTEMQLKGHLSEWLREKLLKIPHVRSVKMENSAFGSIEYQGATWVQGFCRLTEESDEYFNMDMDGDGTYAYLCERDAILITNSDFISGINGVSFQAGDKITLRWFDGTERTAELEIAAVTSDTAPANTGYDICMADKTMEKLWGGMNTASSFAISIEGYETYGEQAEQEIRAALEPYFDLNLSTLREKVIDDSANVQKIKMQIYGISAFMILFSILNLINMVIGNITARKRELSMLESIGMEERQIRKMLFWESIQFVFPAILITLLVGGTAGYGLVLSLQKAAGYMEYRFPIIPSILYAAGVILIPLAISCICLKGQNKVTLAERIKYDD